VRVRLHALNVLDDVLGDASTGKAKDLYDSMRAIANEGRGVLVLIREPHPKSLSDRVRAKIDGSTAPGTELRDYGVGAQILLDLGVKEMILLSNTRRTIIGLEGYGLKVVEQRPIRSVPPP
jgi:3,4-dihydroxy 2-butanone 4-phosphate synthase/GTP cyclohydrolase II